MSDKFGWEIPVKGYVVLTWGAHNTGRANRSQDSAGEVFEPATRYLCVCFHGDPIALSVQLLLSGEKPIFF